MINAPSRAEAAIARRVAEMLQALGAEVAFDEANGPLIGETGNMIARFPGTVDAPPIAFCAHLDTVEPTAGLRIVETDGAFTSDGTTILGADDRAGVAAIIEMLHVLHETGAPHPPLELIFTVAEEIGVMGSQYLDYGMLEARICFVPDSSGEVGLIVTRAPEQQHISVIVRGKAAHAGMGPEHGVSAITVAARAIARMQQGRIDEETTANIGIIKGGKATNIVPDLVTMEGEARSRDPQKLAEQVAHMRECFEQEAAAAGAAVEIVISDVYPAFNIADDSPAVQLAGGALKDIGVTPVIASTGGGSDANFFNQRGIETVVLSAGYHHPHSVFERIDEEQLAMLTSCMLAIAARAAVINPDEKR